MTQYIVHLYREMRLSFTGIEADTPEAAASIARDKPTDDADDIEDCNGEELAALVDLAGDDHYEQSVTVDFEGERQRKAAPALLAALQDLMANLEDLAGEFSICDEIAGGDYGKAAQAAIAQATAAGITPAPADIDIHALLAARRQIALIWSIEDVRQIRPGLDDDQAWEVLQNVDHDKDAELGITWLTLEMAASHLYGDAPETDEAEEA